MGFDRLMQVEVNLTPFPDVVRVGRSDLSDWMELTGGLAPGVAEGETPMAKQFEFKF